ncbi:DUF6215 domain-containing protein [Streptomyces sp. NPDC002888]|uniref:DUF6215 domain-containing protein n=1 Tax=Streptomyces sp. NPDC002888 TaxID=3364668 RepID=UPI003679524E
MAEEVAVAEKGPNAWAQVISAVVVAAALAGGLWALQKTSGADAAGPACSTSKPTQSTKDTKDTRKNAKYLSGGQLCTVLNRPDLPTLLGTPGEEAKSVGSGDNSFSLASGDVPTPEADVTLTTYSVQLSASYDDLPVTGMAGLLGGNARERTVLGRPAVLYSNRTIAFRFNLGGGKADGAPGHIARSLVIAQDPKDGGGSYEIAIWRQDSVPPDDATLLRVAEKVLPTVPGWTA